MATPLLFEIFNSLDYNSDKKWFKQPGDNVKMDETVLEIATDKVDSEVPSTAEGVIETILFNENDVVPIGTVIATMDVYYRRLDGQELNLPCCNVFRVRSGAVYDYLIYMDVNPVLAP